jgi:ABC-type transport system involved in multi-copper enzyme maturation permease subunit
MSIFSKINTIALFTMRDILKSKILLNVFLIGLGMMLLTYVAAEFTYGVPSRVALDSGLGMLTISCLGIALFMGATLISKEIDSRTVYMIISRPVPRYAFICGKVFGLLAVLAINIALLSIMTLASTSFLGGSIDSLVWWSIFFIFLESLLLLLVVLFFSLISNNILAIIITLVLLTLGHAIQDTQGTLFVQNRPLLGAILEFYHLVLPGFYKLNLKDFVLYKQSLPFDYLLKSMSYGLSYSAFLLLMIITIFEKKNLD